jgi:hypothetical protein
MPNVIHVGMPIACAGAVEVGNHIRIDRKTYVVVKVGGAAFDMVLIDDHEYTLDDAKKHQSYY